MIEAFLRFEGAACCEKEASPTIDARLKCCVCLNHSLILVHPYMEYICIVNKKDRRQFVVNVGDGTSEVTSVAVTLVRSEDGDASQGLYSRARFPFLATTCFHFLRFM